MISFAIRTITHISNCCVYCIGDQNLTHTIKMHRHLPRNLFNRPPVYTRCCTGLLQQCQSVSRNSEDYMESVQSIKCMLFILICNKYKLMIIINETTNTQLLLLHILCIYLFLSTFFFSSKTQTNQAGILPVRLVTSIYYLCWILEYYLLGKLLTSTYYLY